MNLPALIRALGAKGMSPEEIADVLEASSPKSTGAERTRRWREKAEREKADGVTVTPVTVTGVTPVTKDARAPTYVRGEDNLSRLVDTSSAVAVAEDVRDPISDWPTGDATRHAQLLAEAAGTGRLDPAKQPGLATTLGRVAAWKRDGASWTYDVVPAVTIMSQKRGPPIATWKYFDPAIAQSVADNRRALATPAANGARHDRPRPSSAKFDAKQANMERSLRGAEIASARRSI